MTRYKTPTPMIAIKKRPVAPIERPMSGDALAIYTALAPVLSLATAMATDGVYDDVLFRSQLRDALTMVLSTQAQRAVDAAVLAQWSTLQRYQVPKDEWMRLYRAAIDEYLPDRITALTDQITVTNRAYIDAGQAHRLGSDARRRSIAVTEAASFHGLCLLRFGLAFQAVMDEIYRGDE